MKINKKLSLTFIVMIVITLATGLCPLMALTAQGDAYYAVVILALFVTMFTSIIMLIWILVSWYSLKTSLAVPAESLTEVLRAAAAGDFKTNRSSNYNSDSLISDLSDGVFDMIASVGALLNDINKMTGAFEKGNTDTRLAATKLKGDYAAAAKGINDMAGALTDEAVLAAGAFKAIGKGDLSAKLADFPGKKRVLNESLEDFRKTMQALYDDMNKRLEAYLNGEFNISTRISGYSGDWAKIMDNLARLQDACNLPVKDITEKLNLLNKGNLAAKSTGDYKGAYAALKQAQNELADNLSLYIKETSDVLREVAKENYNVKITKRYPGDFSQLADAVNRAAIPPKPPKPTAPLSQARPAAQYTPPATPFAKINTPAKTPVPAKSTITQTHAPVLTPAGAAAKKKIAPSGAHIYDRNDYGKY